MATSWSRVPAKTQEVFDYLKTCAREMKTCAREMRTVTYGEIADAVRLAPTGIGWQLGYIRDVACRAQGLPWLNVIAVNQTSRRPGGSFLPEEVAMEESDEETFWRGMVLQVFAFDWSDVSLPAHD